MRFFVARLLSITVIAETYTSDEPADLLHTQQTANKHKLRQFAARVLTHDPTVD